MRALDPLAVVVVANRNDEGSRALARRVRLLLIATEFIGYVSYTCWATPANRPFASPQEETVERVKQFQLLVAQMDA
jgi:hypothetical protein